MFVKRLATLGLLLTTPAILGACTMDPYKGTPVGYYSTSGTLTAPQAAYEDHLVQPGGRCDRYAVQTTPNKAKMMAEFGFNHGVAGGAGGAFGGFMSYTSELNILKVVAATHAVPAVTAATAINAGVQSGFQAAASAGEAHDSMVFNDLKDCLRDDSTGLLDIPPSDGQKVKAGGQLDPTEYVPPSTWGAPIANHPAPARSSNSAGS